MKNKLLIENMSAMDGNIITESTKSNDMFLHGIFMQAEQVNKNGRKYQLTEMATAVSVVNEHIQEFGGLLGELDHPADRLTLAMDRVSHAITELYMDGNNVIGKAKILNTPMGAIAKEIGKTVRYGVSSRGAGQVNESGLVTGFRLVTIDIVATPSAHGAMPKTVFESLDTYKNGGVILSLAEAIREDPAAQKYFKEEMRKFIGEFFK